MDQTDFSKLWRNFIETITDHYADFSGRVGRTQFWYFVLVYIVVGFGVSIVGGLAPMGGSLRALYGLLLFLPTVGITARRLQDTGRPGSWAWLLAVPIGAMILMAIFTIITVLTLGLGALLFLLTPLLSLASLAAIVVLIYFCAQPGEAGPNAYGSPPAPWSPNRDPAQPPATG